MRAPVVKNVRPWLPKVASFKAFLISIGLIGLGVLVRIPLDAIAEEPLPPYITLYPAIVLAAFVGGIRVGLFAVALSAATAWALWMAPPVPGAISAGRLMTAVVYLITASLTVLTSGWARLLLDQLAEEEARRGRAAHESVHRIKNLLAIVQFLSRKISTSAGDVREYRDRLDARLSALAVTQQLLLKAEWEPVSAVHLVQSTLGPFLPNPRLRIDAQCDPSVPVSAAAQISMALYELATNALKYGGLAGSSGTATLKISASDGLCRMEWTEEGFVRAEHPGKPGLGSTVVRTALSSVSGGTVDHVVGKDRVSCVLSWPGPVD